MINKKGVELSLNFVIIAIILLIVLIIGILYFTGALNKIFGTQRDITQAQLDNLISLQKEACISYCQFGNKESYNSPRLNDALKNANINSCSDPQLLGKTFEQCKEASGFFD